MHLCDRVWVKSLVRQKFKKKSPSLLRTYRVEDRGEKSLSRLSLFFLVYQCNYIDTVVAYTLISQLKPHPKTNANMDRIPFGFFF